MGEGKNSFKEPVGEFCDLEQGWENYSHNEL